MSTPTSGPSFAEFLAIEESQLAAQLRAVRAAISHAGEKGRGLEQQAMTLLRRFLPAEYGLATGFVACAEKSTDGFAVRLSPQIDVIIYDAVRGGPLMDLESCKVFPIECVLGVVEIKASLYSELPKMYKHSAAVRSMETRHYVIHQNVQIDPLDAYNQQVSSLSAVGGNSFIEDVRRASTMEHFPPPNVWSGPWYPQVRSFAIAFEYDRNQDFKRESAKARVEETFVHPGHFHGILVPETCMAWNENASIDATRRGKAVIDTKRPLAKFRIQVLSALASFPRPAINMSTDLRPYFGGAVEVSP